MKFVHKKIHTTLHFEVHLTEHCNINCSMCSHFSPLATPQFISVSSFQCDINRLADLFGDKLKEITLLGGEPLLHPEICMLIKIARDAMPNGKLILYTNGILLPQMSEHFWHICKASVLFVTLTRYPIRADYDAINHLLDMHKIPYEYCNTPGREKQMKFLPLDIDGKQDISDSFFKCDIGNRCIFLQDGKLFTCNIPANIHHFNRYFGQKLSTTEKDYIDIYKNENTPADILTFLSQPIPFCRYCDVDKRTQGHLWRHSTRQITEWA